MTTNAPSITLTTDFGLGDPYVGVMKGVILGILPDAQIVDISHAIAPQNLCQAAYILNAAAPYFPPGTVHVVVVDPGVGAERRAIAAFSANACFVGPDNGLFSRVYRQESIREIRELTNPDYHLPQVSNTFHGRDIFAPFAAHIAAGVRPESLGPLITDPVTLDFPEAERLPDGSLRGHIIYSDHFGNLISDIPVDWLGDSSDWIFEIAGMTLSGFRKTYANVKQGEPVILGGGAGLVEVAVRNGNAARQLGLGAGEILIARPAS